MKDPGAASGDRSLARNGCMRFRTRQMLQEDRGSASRDGNADKIRPTGSEARMSTHNGGLGPRPRGSLARPRLTGQAAAQGAGTAGPERLLPERFLREYDPVTCFSLRTAAPAAAARATTPRPCSRFARPGRRVPLARLQYAPVPARQPWPPLRTYSFRTSSGSYARSTLMSPPSSVSPAGSLLQPRSPSRE